MVNTVNILNQADQDSLVLFDELGAGTDPVEGAALGISILTFLKNIGSRIMATTHYSELKLFALSTEGVQNASCEFDVETLRPTYRLLIGVPGKSNAFAISSKLGLPDYIIEDAKSHIDSDNEQFEDVLSEIERQRIQIEKIRKLLQFTSLRLNHLSVIMNLRQKSLMNSVTKFLTRHAKKLLIFLRKLRKQPTKLSKLLINMENPAIPAKWKNPEVMLEQSLKRTR